MQELVQDFQKALKEDVYPPASYEQLFGIKMSSKPRPFDLTKAETGTLVYSIWQLIWKYGHLNESEVCKAISNNTLPDYFEKAAMRLKADMLENGYQSPILNELERRGFSCIYWASINKENTTKESASKKENKSKRTASGVHIDGSNVVNCNGIVFDEKEFEPCPGAHAVGLPLYVKRLPIKTNELSHLYLICRMMSLPSTGLAPYSWSYGGELGPAPPVLVVRSDYKPFTSQDWALFDDFLSFMLSDGPCDIERDEFMQYARNYNPVPRCQIAFEAVFPIGESVVVNGLVSRPELNGSTVTVTGDYQNGRIGVMFDGLGTPLAIKPENLTLMEN